MPEIRPECVKWLRKLRLCMINHQMGIKIEKIPIRVVEELQKLGKIHFDHKGNAVYTVQLSERLKPENRKWTR